MGASKLLVEFDQDVDPSKPSVRPGKMLVCATKTDESETVTFRNYIPPDEVVPEYRDSEECPACSVLPPANKQQQSPSGTRSVPPRLPRCTCLRR